ncbi:relaxase/mobilization nuclease domain-containing protein [Sulfurimonas sp.]|nr:hypothetical protein [Sulfurimonas sp.]
MNLAQEYEEYDRAGKKAKAIRSKVMHFKSPNSNQIAYYDGVPTPVVFKIIKNIDKATGKTNRNVGYSTMKALDYLARDVDELNEEAAPDKIEQMEQNRPDFLDKNLVLECDDGRKLESKQDRLILYNEWKETFTNRKNGKDFEHILLSTKEAPGTHDKEILDAARQTLSKQFAKDGYNYIFVLHRDREHTHVHAIVRVHNAMEDKRLDIKKDDINKVKDTFASELRSRGLNYENFINFNKILGINSQLKYLQHNDLSWFQSNMKKFENENIDGLLKTIKSIDKDLEILIKQKENIKLLKKDKKVISDNISHLYADKRAIIHKLNGLEYDLQQATKNYTSLIKKRDSIEWYLKQTGAYKEIDKRTNEAQELVIQKKLELNKAQLYIETTKGELTFNSKIKKDTLYYLNDYLKDDSKKDINSLLYRLNTLETKMPKSKLVKEIKELKKDILDDEYHTTIKSDFLKVLNEVKSSNKAIPINDEFTNNFIKNIDKKLDVVINNVKNNKDVSARDMKSIGFDLNTFESSTKVYQVDHIKNTPENLKEFEKFKEYFDKKNYQTLVKELQENKLIDRNFNYALEKATNNENIKLLPVDLKRSLELEKREVEVEILNIDSYHKYLNDNQNTIYYETVSTAIFNSGKFLETISSRLKNELGIEIKTKEQLSQNMNKIGKHSELRKLIDNEIHKNINDFRKVHKLEDNNTFKKYLDKIETKKASKTKLSNEEKELNNLTGFLQKNAGLYPIFESDMRKINLNTLEFKDKMETSIKVDVVPVNDNTRGGINNIFDTMMQNSHDKKVQVKINEIDLKAINKLENQYKTKAEFKDKAKEYIKAAANKSESKKYLAAVLDTKTLSGMQYMINEDKIKEVPKSFLESRNIDTANLPVEKIDKKVFTIAMSSKENLELFKNREIDDIQELNNPDAPINLDSFSDEAYEIIKNQNYKEVFTEIENMKFENLSMKKNKNDFYKLFAVISNAKDAKDIDTLVEAYKLDSFSDKSQMIKDFGKALNVNPKNIKKNIWYSNTKQPPPEVWSKADDMVLETLVHDYKEQFIEEYVNEISIEYLLFMSERNDIPGELIQKNIDEFNKGLEDFKEEYFLNEEYQKNIESVKEHLKYGEFKSAREVIENSNLGEVDIKILDGYYEEHIDMFANDLESAALHINKENELDKKTYLLEDFVENDKHKYPPKKEQVFIKPKEIAKELETDLKIPTEIKEELEPISPTKHDKLKVQYVNKEKEFINKLIVTLDKSLNEQKAHDYKDMIFKASKTLSSELKRNVNQIEDIKRVLEEMPKNYKVEKKCLEENLNDFFYKANKTNDAVKQYIETIDKSDLDNKSKLEYKLGLYDELAKYRYSERIIDAIPGIKNEMLDRGIEHFKLINKQLETPKIDKETKLELLDKSSQLLKDFNKLNPTWKQERTISKLHKEQVKNLKQRDMER